MIMKRTKKMMLVAMLTTVCCTHVAAQGVNVGDSKSMIRIDGIIPVTNIQHGGGEDHRGWMEQGRTVIIISHNIGQIIDADQIYVLQQGRVVQHGSPDEVYRQGGVYKDIFDASARSMNVDKIASTINI